MELEQQKTEALSEYPLKIHNFVYNGFYAQDRPGYAKYTCRFVKWTNDAGIFEAECSDGKLRYIPSCYVHEYMKSLPSEPDYDKMKKEGTFIWFGYPSRS